MGDLLYQRKFNEMQKYIPFLERVIEKLKKNDNDKPRKAQLEKMQMLHNLLNNKQKKLKIETLLKCESVLKKLHAKIDKSDDLSPPMTLNKPSTTATTTAPNTSSVVPKKVQPTTLKSARSSSSSSTSPATKFVSRCNLIEINTCPASPTQLGDEDFRPPVEIPTERRSSPRRLGSAIMVSKHEHKPQHELGKPIPTVGPRFQNNRPTDYYRSNYHQLPQQQQQQQQHIHHQQQQHHHQPLPQHNQHHYPPAAAAGHRSRWSDPKEWPPEPPPSLPPPSNSSSHVNNRSWSSSSSSAPSSNYRSHGQQKKVEQKKVYSSEEENWDDPEDEPAAPPPKPAPKAPPHSVSSSASHSQQREPSNSSYQHRHNEKNKNHSRDAPPTLPALPELNLDNDAFQKKLFHDTIFKYKKPDPPIPSFNPFMNPPPPETPAAATSASNIFNRLGDKVESKVDFENFRIEVKNDKMKPKQTAKIVPPPPSHPPPQPPPPPPPAVPIDEVLKSPPLSADDIDDLLNESLEAAIGKPIKPKPIEQKRDDKESALEAVRKKLAMISKPSRSGLESPPPAASKDKDEREPFYRRGHTPTKSTAESVKYNSTPPQTSQRELFKAPPLSESTPKSPSNPIDPVIERLALKYNPHRRRDSMSAMPQQNNDKPNVQSPPIRDHIIEPIGGGDRLALKYNPHPRRDSIASPLRTADPRVGKMLGQVSPLVTSPIAVSPLANVSSASKPFDPRLRNAPPPATFCTPIPFTKTIPSLLDLNLKGPPHMPGYPSPKPVYGIPPASRLDPRKHKVQATIYTEKFNPERNDQTERMKYLESKKKKPPEPKTYGEYRQSKCRQQAAEEAAKATTPVESVPSMPSVQTNIPSTIDKMYRNADYCKEMGGNIHSFKIPKKPKSEEPIEPKVDEPVKPEEPVNKIEESVKKLNEPVKKVDEPAKKPDESVKKVDERVKKPVEPVEIEKPVNVSVDELDEPMKAPAEEVKSAKCEKKPIGDDKKTSTTLKESQKKEQEPQKPSDIGNEIEEINQDTTLDETKSECSLVIDEAEIPHEEIVKRSPGRPGKRKLPPRAAKKLDQDSAVKIEPFEKEEDVVEEEEEEEEEEIKPRRITGRRSTILKDNPKPEEIEQRQRESLSPTRCRSASDIFAPTTDNSIVSTQNIIAGKRRTRATINFNEKATKKPVTPKQAQPPVTSPATTPKNRGKPGPKAAAKKTPPVVASTRTRRQASGKQTSDDGQICAVSSTTSQGGDVDDSHNEDTLNAEDVGTSEEPTSSALKPAQAPVVDADENNKKQEWLEGFLKSIVDPTTNKDRILDMLKAVLDEKKLQQVKDILYSPEDEERDAAVNVKKQPEMSKPRATRTKKNELDRLNEDIRDMFICQGVVTATGRRMCTLAKDTSNVKPAKPKEQQKEKKSLRLKEDSSSATPSPTCKRRMRRAKVIISPLNMRALRSRVQKPASPPEMPVLEPNTPIKLSGEDDDCEGETQVVKTAKKKPGPKSKRAPSLSMESDDDDIQLVHLRKKIKGENNSKCEKVETEEQTTDEEETEDDETEEEEADEEIESKTVKKEQEKKEEKQEKVENKKEKQENVEPKPEKVIPKNTNPDWHTMSEYATCCVICKEKSRHMAPHYLMSHNDSEVYTSRLPPAVLEDMKANTGNRALYSIAKKPSAAFHYRCPFCDFQSTSTLRCWMDHFTCHTGEYQHKCSGCFKAMNGSSHMMEHIKKSCPTAKKLNREPVSMRGNFIAGFVCPLCNFVQMLRGGVIRHLQVQHDQSDDKTISQIFEVKLIDTTGVPKMEEGSEAKGVNLPTFPTPALPANKPSESNLQVFLSRELASPTSDVLSERLKSIEQEDGMASDSSVITISPFKAGQAPAAGRITIAERLTQRFKNIDKQNLLEDERTEGPVLIEANKDVNTEPIPVEVEDVPPPSTTAAAVAAAALPINSPTLDDSLNESCNLIIDEQEGDKSTVDGDGSDSEWADDNDEDDNENWEDIEITETKGTLQKDRNKNKSIFQTLSRLYASIAPKKGSKKTSKDKEKRKIDTTQQSETPIQVVKQTASSAATATAPPPPPPAQKPLEMTNLSDLLPDSPTDSLDVLLATNFNCLEGDGTSFPHLDLNDLDSPIFLMPGEQTNLQDAIAMATDVDQIKYDVLGNPLPSPFSQSLQKPISSPASVQHIGNYGFSLNGSTFKYYCMVKACTFLFSDHPDGLQNHFLLEHPSLKWNGYCHTCKAQVGPSGGREMQHMLDTHSNPKTVQQSSDKPRIKFRRLTGDILSTGKQQPPSPPSLAALPLPPVVEAPIAKKSKLCLSTLLQSKPKAMIQPAPPPAFENDIPLYKNVSKEFTITGVAEGVTDDDLRKLVFNQSESVSGGLQISQVISLNAGGKSMSPSPLSRDFTNIATEHRKSPSVQLQDNRSHSNSPIPFQTISIPSAISVTCRRNSVVPMANASHAFKCGATQCQFSTNIRTAMNEHVLFHLRTDNDRGSLKCHECTFTGRSITDYFQHMANGHARPSSKSPCLQTNDLTQKIQDILRATANPSTSKPADEDKDPLEIEITATPSERSFSDKLKQVAEEMVAETGMAEAEVWKCPLYPECTRPITEWDFLAHVANHTAANNSTKLQCPHCTVTYHRAGILKAHMKTHARHQYFCYMCCATCSSFQQAQKHFSEFHSRYMPIQAQQLILDEVPGKNPSFLLISSEKLCPMEVVQFGEKLLAEWERKKSLTKTHFQPHEQYLLPLQPIFNNQVCCSVCNYKTKVRTNMYRHLQLHKQEVDVASVDPVNPVPCLEKNVKHFDKMTNLACSSNATAGGPKSKESAVKIPAFVPDMRRFVCGHPGCTYLTITDQMLRSHLNALHSGEKGYQCPHCQEDICKKSMCPERIVQHLKFHGSKIYQCGECDYLHYTKHVVERHVNEKHHTVPFVNLITYDRTEGEVNKTTQIIVAKSGISGISTPAEIESSEAGTTANTPVANKCKWECALCKHQTVTWNQMISHANGAHRAKHQYTCVHCSFGSAQLVHIMDHIDTKHPTKTREAKYVFYKINETPQDKAADTRPLWSRDDPKRVRSIRGILMENEEDAERTKQSLSNAGVDLDDEDDDVEIVQVIESESAMKPGVLGCFHCDFKSEDMTALTTHWKMKHWHAKNHESMPKLPFFFRIHSILKCPSCTFIGDYVSLQLHAFNKHGQRTFCAADPKLPNTCGHCPFVYPPKRLEILTRHYHREHKPTDVKNLSSGLLKSVLTLGECQVYMQCYFCAEICADKAAIIDHERERHASSNFRYKQIKDEVIYRCGMCQYSSTNEMATLRHMIDHFGGFMHCHFCFKDQTSFNAYMQHCYASHPKELKDFKTFYTLADLTAFLGQMLLIFPNGLIVNKRNLMHTQYGSTERILAMYDEICKKALEPPIPPLCMARLMAKKMTEARESTLLLPPPPVPVTAKRIAKRRSTVAISVGDRGLSDFLVPSGPQKLKKRKSSISEDRPIPPAPLFSAITSSVRHDEDTQVVVEASNERLTVTDGGVSFYGKKPEPIDLSKIYTQIAIGDKYAPVSVKKFALLIKMNAKVLVDRMDFGRYRSTKRRRAFGKPCPASKKKYL